MKRVVVTGIGVVSCLGNNQDEVYQSLLNLNQEFLFQMNTKSIILKVTYMENQKLILKTMLIENL